MSDNECRQFIVISRLKNGTGTTSWGLFTSREMTQHFIQNFFDEDELDSFDFETLPFNMLDITEKTTETKESL
tara:strand:+ start:64 stop:282 length:219 start_codon:yes stop_codon:yes gene_type:complete